MTLIGSEVRREDPRVEVASAAELEVEIPRRDEIQEAPLGIERRASLVGHIVRDFCPLP